MVIFKKINHLATFLKVVTLLFALFLAVDSYAQSIKFTTKPSRGNLDARNRSLNTAVDRVVTQNETTAASVTISVDNFEVLLPLFQNCFNQGKVYGPNNPDKDADGCVQLYLPAACPATERLISEVFAGGTGECTATVPAALHLATSNLHVLTMPLQVIAHGIWIVQVLVHVMMVLLVVM